MGDPEECIRANYYGGAKTRPSAAWARVGQGWSEPFLDGRAQGCQGRVLDDLPLYVLLFRPIVQQR